MSIINKQLSKDPQYMVDARDLYDEDCIPIARKIMKKEVSRGRWDNRHQVQSYEVVKSILSQLGREQQIEIEKFKKVILTKVLRVLTKYSGFCFGML
jgi:hypothetical protein